MKKAMIVLITVSSLIACGTGTSGEVVTNDSTAVKTDSTLVDTTATVDTTTVK